MCSIPSYSSVLSSRGLGRSSQIRRLTVQKRARPQAKRGGSALSNDHSRARIALDFAEDEQALWSEPIVIRGSNPMTPKEKHLASRLKSACCACLGLGDSMHALLRQKGTAEVFFWSILNSDRARQTRPHASEPARFEAKEKTRRNQPAHHYNTHTLF